MADTDQSSEILGTPSVRTTTWPPTATAAKQVPAKEDSVKEDSANGTSAADENGTGKGHALADVPALPADSIGSARDPFSLSRPVSGPVSPVSLADEDWTLSDIGTSAPDTAHPPAENEPVAAETGTGTGWPAESSAAQPSDRPEASAVSAAAFVWDPPEPAPTSPSSPARNFLRSSAGAKTSAAPRTPAVSVDPPKARPGPGVTPVPVPGARPRPKGPAKRSARQAHLTIARVEPWSVMKFSFVVSLVAFVILFVAVSVIYGTLSALGVFTSLQHVVQSVTSSQDSTGVNAARWFTASRILSYTALLGAINIVLITAMCTIGAVVYNLTSRLIGGVEVTLRETE
ncbi:MAG TPA: DUF3566 domain-containing protein [Streptosporangiaceae bacterium]